VPAADHLGLTGRQVTDGDGKTVAAVKAELVKTAEIPQFTASGGRGVTTGDAADPDTTANVQVKSPARKKPQQGHPL
jgi:hypothetical protein